MQEKYTHLHKRHLVLKLFNNDEPHEETDWISPEKELPKCKSSCVVTAKFSDGSTEKVFFSNRVPHWWYFAPYGRRPVITKEIVEWKH